MRSLLSSAVILLLPTVEHIFQEQWSSLWAPWNFFMARIVVKQKKSYIFWSRNPFLFIVCLFTSLCSSQTESWNWMLHSTKSLSLLSKIFKWPILIKDIIKPAGSWVEEKRENYLFFSSFVLSTLSKQRFTQWGEKKQNTTVFLSVFHTWHLVQSPHALTQCYLKCLEGQKDLSVCNWWSWITFLYSFSHSSRLDQRFFFLFFSWWHHGRQECKAMGGLQMTWVYRSEAKRKWLIADVLLGVCSATVCGSDVCDMTVNPMCFQGFTGMFAFCCTNKKVKGWW